MKLSCLVVAIVALASLPAFGDDQAKAQKQLARITAMASDLTGRRAVGIMMSDVLSVNRQDLVKFRKQHNLNYGSLFLAQQLIALGMPGGELDSQLRSGKSIVDVANARHVEWKQILAEGRKLNSKVERHLFEYFFDSRADHKRDNDEGYSITADSVKADEDVDNEAVNSAADAFARARDWALQRPGRHVEQGMNAADELQFRRDHSRENAPKPSDVGMNTTQHK